MKKNLFVFMAVIAALGGPGCFSEHAGDKEFAESSAPIVDAFIEYPGPLAKWSGPGTFVLHVSTKDAGNAVIAIGSPLSNDRSLASPSMTRVSSEDAKAQLNKLYEAGKDDEKFVGCLAMVKIRIIRSDGVVFTREGCRATSGWPKVASEVASYFMKAQKN